jgi:hypothetical protein
MTLWELNAQFARDYIKVYRRIHKTNIDRATAEKRNPIKIETVFTPGLAPLDRHYIADRRGIRAAVHKARLFADDIGAPYEALIGHAMDFHLNVGRERKHLPAPNQLIPREDGRKWKKFQASLGDLTELIKCVYIPSHTIEHPDWTRDDNYKGCFGIAATKCDACRACKQVQACVATLKVNREAMNEAGAETKAERAKRRNAERAKRYRSTPEAKQKRLDQLRRARDRKRKEGSR